MFGLMRKIPIALMTLSLLSGARLALGQQDQPATESQSTVYYAVVIGDGTIEGSAKVVPIGPERSTKAEAEQDEERWKEAHPTSLRITVTREKTRTASKLKQAADAADKLQEAKEAVDKAKEIKEEGLTAQERQLGDTLREYMDRIQDTYEKVKKLKSNMLSMTGKISQKQFDEVNKLIASYNKSRDELGKVDKQLSAARSERLKPGFSGGSPKGPAVSVLEKFPTMDTLNPNNLKGFTKESAPAGSPRIGFDEKTPKDKAANSQSEEARAKKAEQEAQLRKQREWADYQEKYRAWQERQAAKAEAARAAQEQRERQAAERAAQQAEAQRQAAQEQRERQEAARAAQQAARDSSAIVVGTWSGSYSETANHSCTLVFDSDRTVSSSMDGRGGGHGTWSYQNGTVVISWSDGASVTYAVNGTSMSGSGTTPRGTTWSLSLQK